MIFEALVTLSAVLSAAIAAVTGFGIGSIMTPLLSLEMELKVAVALVSLPHFAATAERFWRLRKEVDRSVLIRFGITSALGGLLGAFLNTRFNSPLLTVIFGGLLVFAGFTGVTGLAEKVRFGNVFAWVAGFFSGMFGGLVGNQGGIRAAAMLTFGLTPEAFVATSTAIGLVVDFARMPIYLATEGREVFSHGLLIGLSLVGVTAGTLLGVRVLAHTPKHLFGKAVSFLILLLGIAMLYKGVA
jgi:uncharacterized membrane protein YfcA